MIALRLLLCVSLTDAPTPLTTTEAARVLATVEILHLHVDAVTADP